MDGRPDKSWEDAVERWCEVKVGKATLSEDRTKFRHFEQFFGGKRLSDITADDVHQAISAVDGAPGTKNKYAGLIRALLRKAQEWDWLSRAPKVQMYKDTQRRTDFLTKDQAKRLLGELPQHLRDMAEFALMTGLRAGNVKGLKWSQVDLDRKVAWVHPDEAKARRAIRVPLNRRAMEILRSVKGQHTEYVFTYEGHPVTQVSTKAWKKATKRAEVEWCRFHDLRHTFASWHVMAGTSLQELKELGGWSTLTMVERYAHLAPDHLAEAAERVLSSAGRASVTLAERSHKTVTDRASCWARDYATA